LSSKKRRLPPREPDRCDVCDRTLGPNHPKEDPYPDDPYRTNVESHLFSGLKDHGCTVVGDPDMDGVYKIDILVANIRNWLGDFAPVGLQITAGQDVVEKIRRFRTESIKWKGVEGMPYARWPALGSLIYVEVIGYVSHRTIRALKAVIELVATEAKKDSKNSPKPLIKRVRLYQNGDFSWLPLEPPEAS
jgi:hypothetical protein